MNYCGIEDVSRSAVHTRQVLMDQVGEGLNCKVAFDKLSQKTSEFVL